MGMDNDDSDAETWQEELMNRWIFVVQRGEKQCLMKLYFMPSR